MCHRHPATRGLGRGLGESRSRRGNIAPGFRRRRRYVCHRRARVHSVRQEGGPVCQAGGGADIPEWIRGCRGSASWGGFTTVSTIPLSHKHTRARARNPPPPRPTANKNNKASQARSHHAPGNRLQVSSIAKATCRVLHIGWPTASPPPGQLTCSCIPPRGVCRVPSHHILQCDDAQLQGDSEHPEVFLDLLPQLADHHGRRPRAGRDACAGHHV